MLARDRENKRVRGIVMAMGLEWHARFDHNLLVGGMSRGEYWPTQDLSVSLLPRCISRRDPPQGGWAGRAQGRWPAPTGHRRIKQIRKKERFPEESTVAKDRPPSFSPLHGNQHRPLLPDMTIDLILLPSPRSADHPRSVRFPFPCQPMRFPFLSQSSNPCPNLPSISSDISLDVDLLPSPRHVCPPRPIWLPLLFPPIGFPFLF